MSSFIDIKINGHFRIERINEDTIRLHYESESEPITPKETPVENKPKDAIKRIINDDYFVTKISDNSVRLTFMQTPDFINNKSEIEEDWICKPFVDDGEVDVTVDNYKIPTDISKYHKLVQDEIISFQKLDTERKKIFIAAAIELRKLSFEKLPILRNTKIFNPKYNKFLQNYFRNSTQTQACLSEILRLTLGIDNLPEKNVYMNIGFIEKCVVTRSAMSCQSESIGVPIQFKSNYGLNFGSKDSFFSLNNTADDFRLADITEIIAMLHARNDVKVNCL